ncbi:MAG: hypothetical protein KGQ28_03850 [Hyphomicrobiales bacterium]|nr:hypothetical protein [Hyphomicrobiales bacterium]
MSTVERSAPLPPPAHGGVTRLAFAEGRGNGNGNGSVGFFLGNGRGNCQTGRPARQGGSRGASDHSTQFAFDLKTMRCIRR